MKIIVIGCALLLSGCVTALSQSNLYWGNYSNTKYETKKNPGDASDAEHEEELKSIVSKSKELNLRVPPGVYAELGLSAMKKGEDAKARAFFTSEKNVYPEGSILMNKLLQETN